MDREVGKEGEGPAVPPGGEGSQGPEGPGPEAGEGSFLTAEDAAALEDEQRTVAAAASTPATGAAAPKPSDRPFPFGLVALVLVLLLAWGGGLVTWQVRRDLGALEARVAAGLDRTERLEALQTRGALLRARAELEALRRGLPPELAAQVERAEALLEEVADRHAGDP
ncbi:MAG: hypothetical protein SCH98_06690 [Deferrisomatales bacterium]|nr:hypothetical protein [Deferrisomatales bacterium]